MFIDFTMRIGVLTYHCVPNFGAQLQAISTVGFLKRMGHDPIVLHWYPENLETMYQQRIPTSQLACHETFTQEILPLSNLCRTEHELCAEIGRLGLDGIIAGSDALFKYTPMKVRNHPIRRLGRMLRGVVPVWDEMKGNPFFGHFMKSLANKIPICAFSVSSQNSPYKLLTSSEVEFMKEGLGAYSHITVRDEWTKGMVETVLGRDGIAVTPDPVFSFNSNVYFPFPSKQTVLEKYNLPEDYVLLSFSKHYMKESYISELAIELKRNGLTPVAFPMPEGLRDFGIENRIPLPLNPLDWFALIKYSRGYIGERMHPIVVALHNSVPFFCFDEYGTYNSFMDKILGKHILSSSKTYLILKRAGLDDYMYSYHSKNAFPSCENVVKKILGFDRKKCALFSEEMQCLYTKSMEHTLNMIVKAVCVC